VAGLHHQSSVLFGTLEGISKPIEGKQSELKLETGAGAGGAGDTGSLKVELLWPRECSGKGWASHTVERESSKNESMIP
jgi:hypothetical protein